MISSAGAVFDHPDFVATIGELRRGWATAAPFIGARVGFDRACMGLGIGDALIDEGCDFVGTSPGEGYAGAAVTVVVNEDGLERV